MAFSPVLAILVIAAALIYLVVITYYLCRTKNSTAGDAADSDATFEAVDSLSELNSVTTTSESKSCTVNSSRVSSSGQDTMSNSSIAHYNLNFRTLVGVRPGPASAMRILQAQDAHNKLLIFN